MTTRAVDNEHSLPGYGELMRNLEEKMKLDPREMIGDYIVEGVLGEGTFGTVKLGIHHVTMKKAALKFIDYSKCKSQKEKDNIKREIQIMQLLDHPNIVRLQDVIEIPERNATCLVLEYIQGGELFDYIVANGKLKESEATRFFRQMLQGAEYCHMNFVIHRDLKPENLLLDADKNLKINDFGLSNIMEPGRFLESYCGSPLYVAPEILAEVHYIGPEVDIWAMGVILFVMVSGYIPWDVSNLREQMQNALRANYEIPGHVSRDCAELIDRILTVDPRKRATIAEIKAHRWVNRGYSGPITSYVPVSHTILSVRDVDVEILENLKKVGFEERDVVDELLSGKSTKQSYVLYFLMVAKKRREQEKLEAEMVLTPRSRAALHAQTRDKSYEMEFPHKSKVRKTSLEGNASPTLSRANQVQILGTVRGTQSIVLRNTTPINSPRVTSQKLSPVTVPIKKPSIFKFFKKNVQNELPSTPEQEEPVETRRRLTIDGGNVSPIQERHAEDDKELRVSKGAFTVETTTMKQVSEIEIEIERVLKHLEIPFKKKGTKYAIKPKDSKLQVSIEICKISKLEGLKGIKFKRVGGDVWKYKEMYDSITKELRL